MKKKKKKKKKIFELIGAIVIGAAVGYLVKRLFFSTATAASSSLPVPVVESVPALSSKKEVFDKIFEEGLKKIAKK